jgi:hypothetical protein
VLKRIGRCERRHASQCIAQSASTMMQTFSSQLLPVRFCPAELRFSAGNFHSRFAATPTVSRLHVTFLALTAGAASTSSCIAASGKAATPSSASRLRFTAGCVLVVFALDDGPTCSMRAVILASMAPIHNLV